MWRQVGQVVVVLGDGDVGLFAEGPQGRHSCDQAVVGQHDTLGVACMVKALEEWQDKGKGGCCSWVDT